MKLFLILALVCVAYSKPLNEEVEREFQNFKTKFGRIYKSTEEENARKAIFNQNYLRITEHNRLADNGVHSYRLAVNQFADMTVYEFKEKMNGFKPEKKVRFDVKILDDIELPKTVDWRKKGVVTPVKNQEQCGSCWAFSAVASIEGQHALDTKKLVSLSEQNLVDCSGDEGNMGCNGGLMDQAFEYVKKNHGIDTEKSYPYKAVDQQCHFKKQTVGATLQSFKDIKSGSESQLQKAVANIGPISVAIDASSESFQFYSSGVYVDTECGNQRENLDHGVTAVGYGVEDGKDYWLVKNSWGETWGEKGYILMSRNKDNMCGIATMASYPTGVKSI